MKKGQMQSKEGNSGLVISLVILVLLIIGLVVGIFINKANQEAAEISNAEAELESLTEQAVDSIINKESTVDTDEVVSKLENILKLSKNQDKLVKSATLLTSLYDDEEKEVSVLKDLLNRDLDDVHRSMALDALLVISKKYGRDEDYKKALTELVELPDDLELEYENWPMLKAMYRSELNSLMEGDNNEE